VRITGEVDVRRLLNERDAWRLEERRKEARYTLILRVGVMEQDGKSSICLVKNISSTGAQVKVYTAAVADTKVALRVADEPPVHGQLVWLKEGIAGISFDDELDAATLLRVRQKLKPNRRRAMPRVAVHALAMLRAAGQTSSARVRDISSGGARVRARTTLMPGDRAMVSLDGLPTLSAYVRWNNGEECGVAFDTPIPMQIIATWLEARMPLGA
jgi:hypothetical protein